MINSPNENEKKKILLNTISEMSESVPLYSAPDSSDIPIMSKDGAGKGSKTPELINPEINEVLNHPPNWLLQWGITLCFLVMILILFLTWFLKYPDLISSSVRILPSELPKKILVRTEGRLEKLLIDDGQKVTQGDILAYIESTSEHEEVLQLEKAIDQLIFFEDDIERIYGDVIPHFFRLGELQRSYQTFQETYIRTKSVLKSGTFHKKKNTIAAEISSLNILRESTNEQLSLQEKELQLTLEEAQSQQRLSEKGFVSKLEAKNAMSRYLGKKQAYEQAKTSLENNSISQIQKRQELVEIEKTIEEHVINLIQTTHSLKSDIEQWKQRYIVKAPIDGIIHFTSSLQENQQITSGDEIMMVSPVGNGFYGEMWVGQYNFGKVKTGQEVIVKLQSYPFQEFGIVRGKIQYISEIPKDSVTLLKVSFPDGLQTNSGKILPFKYGMMATGEIVTEDMRLIERFFYDIRKSLKR